MHLSAVESGKISKAVAYDNRHKKIKAPFADIKIREINLQETYLSHLWAFIYSVFVMYEEGIQRPLINNTFDGNLKFESDLLKRAKLLFDWSVSLGTKYSQWDENLPNPKKHNSTEEKFYAEKVNGIFQSAVAFLMYHEFSHLTQGHDSFFLGVKACDLDDSAISERIQIENEADAFAFDMLISEQDDEKQRWIKGLSILFVICSAVLIVPSANSIEQKMHPDLDQRMLNFLHRLNLETDEAQFYCWYLCSFAIRFYLLKHDIAENPKTYETAQDAFFSYLEVLDQIKEK